MAEPLIVNLEEFAELVGRTPETMKLKLRGLDPQPAWLITRGDRGRGYEIEAHGGVAWFHEAERLEAAASEERRLQLQQLRLDLIGDQSEPAERMALSGKQRREEYEAAFKALEYRRRMGELIERAEVDRVLTSAGVDLRRRLMMVPGEFAVMSGVPVEQVRPLEDLLGRAVDAFVKAIEVGDD